MDKQTEIMSAAKTLIARFGLKKTTTDDIAQKAKVSKATVYRYYKCKEDIFHEICKQDVDELWNAVSKEVESQTSIRDKLIAHLQTKIVKLHELVKFYSVTPELWLEYRPYIDFVQSRIGHLEIGMLVDILETGNRSGELNVKQTDMVAHIMITSLKSLENPFNFNKLGIPLDKYIKLMVDTLIQGIGAR